MSEDIHSLLGRYFSGEATEEERGRVKAWVAGSEANREEYRLLEKLWKGAGEAPAEVFDTRAAWSKVDTLLQPKAAVVKPMFPRRLAIAVAASLVLVLSFWWLLDQRLGMNTVVARAGVKSIGLPDGSMVHLRPGSRLKYRNNYGDDRRAVTLEGEAFFEVQKNPSKRFVIAAGAGEVTVLGTSFLVDEERDIVRVVVQTGSVQLRSAKDTATAAVLVAGERGVLSGAEISKGQNTDQNFRAWQTGMLVFNDTPLPQVAAALGNYYGVTLRLRPSDQAALSAVRVTISFKSERLPDALEQLSMITTYPVKQVGDRTYEISQD
jgi:ferric-dicitrate binding protein FerR (iron transport regulator)